MLLLKDKKSYDHFKESYIKDKIIGGACFECFIFAERFMNNLENEINNKKPKNPDNYAYKNLELAKNNLLSRKNITGKDIISIAKWNFIKIILKSHWLYGSQIEI